MMLGSAYGQQTVYAAQPVAVGAPPPPAIGLPPPAISASAKMLTVTSPHFVDEASPAISAHNIISVPAGARVRLLQGTLTGGLGAPYNDYVLVDYNGKSGKISRLVVVEA